MEIGSIMQPDIMNLDLKATQKTEAIQELIALLFNAGAVNDTEEMFIAVMKREEEFSTGVGMGIAIPHAKSSSVNHAAVAFGRSTDRVKWVEDAEEDVNLIFLIAVPNDAQNEHLRMLAQISRKLIHDEVREQILKADTPQQVLDALQ